MVGMQLYNRTCAECSKLVTRRYSTSFSIGVRLLGARMRNPIYAIYGFVRLADEIVDTFHQHPKKELLDRFKQDTYSAIEEGISLNPILNSFQHAVNEFGIERAHIDTFLKSMEMDLYRTDYSQEGYEEYILGSAEVVGLMCLKVFCEGDQEAYDKLKPYAMRLGSAFQKINFLRDLQMDYQQLGRTYFPGIEIDNFDQKVKREIEQDIKADFDAGLQGIRQLPASSRFGVYVAYVYYLGLFRKIQNTPPSRIMERRIRIPNRRKFALVVSSYVRHSLNML